LYPTTSNGGPLLTFAHCPNFRTAPAARYRFVSDLSGLVGRYQWPSLKVSNFEQTIAGVCAVLVITGGLRCSDLIQRHQALFGLVALCVNFSNASKMEQRRDGQ
jgi:hypothetical protein